MAQGDACPGEAKEGPASVSTSASIGYLVRETHRAFSRSLQARIGPHGIAVGMWFFLRALWEEDGISLRVLSQRVGMMEPTTFTALRNMDRRGLIRRVPNQCDRRVINIFLASEKSPTNKSGSPRSTSHPAAEAISRGRWSGCRRAPHGARRRRS
jgi:hypothetical protein